MENETSQTRKNVARLAAFLMLLSVALFIIDGVRSCSSVFNEIKQGTKSYRSR